MVADDDPLQMSLPEEPVLTVSEVNRMAKSALERLNVLVRGEVSGLNTRYKMIYLNLRDASANLPAIMSRRVFDAAGFEPADGAIVLARGRLTIYEQQGRYQLFINEVRPFGEGDILLRIRMLLEKLTAEGLTAPERKRPLPRIPERIGVVTSPVGAAIRDIVATISRRFPAAQVFIRGVQVQGEGAVEQICEGLEFFDTCWPVDLVILGRGGGSIEDLEPFSAEAVARKVAAMSVPVVTGIGHEPDNSVADAVADVRASTPTAAAEAAVPDRGKVHAQLSNVNALLLRCLTASERDADARLAGSVHKTIYRSPDALLSAFMQRLDRASAALPGSPSRGLMKNEARLNGVSSRPVYGMPGELLARRRTRLESLAARLEHSAALVVERRAGALAGMEGRMKALSPLAVLDRGYSITFKSNGAVVADSADVETGEGITVRLARGTITGEVTGKEA